MLTDWLSGGEWTGLAADSACESVPDGTVVVVGGGGGCRHFFVVVGVRDARNVVVLGSFFRLCMRGCLGGVLNECVAKCTDTFAIGYAWRSKNAIENPRRLEAVL